MKTRRWIATCVVALLGVTAVLAKDIRVVVFKVAQMHCEKCEKKVKDNMRFEKGLKDLSTEVKTKTVTITYDADKTNVKNLQAGFKKFNYEAEFVKETKKDDKKADKKLQSPNQKIPDRKTKCVIKTHINIKQNVIFGAKLKPV